MTQPPENPTPPSYPPPPSYPKQPPAPYGQPQPQPGGWQPPPGYQPPAYPGQQQPVPSGTNKFAIASLVLSILGTVCFASVVTGIVALVQIGRTGQKGRGLAIAGLVISGLWIVGGVALGVVGVINAGPDRDESGKITDGGDVSSSELKTGDCLNMGELQKKETIGLIPAVPCSEAHDGEVYAVVKLSGTDYLGDTKVAKQADETCSTRVEKSLRPKAIKDSTVGVFVLRPTAYSWARGDHGVTCIAVTDDKRTGSILK